MPPKGKKVVPAPPLDEELAQLIRQYFRDGISDLEAALMVTRKYESQGYQLSVWKYRTYRESLGLFSTVKQDHTVESASAALAEAREKFPNAGVREMKNILRTQSGEESMRVSRGVMREWMEETEPEAVQQRRGQVVKRRQFYSEGVNEIWAIDQHDKWGRKFCLWLHVGLDVFSGRVLWLKVYWTNSNPRLICSYYLNTIEQLGGIMPLLTHSDPGSENYGVANAQSTMRQMLDPSLEGTAQHRWLKKHSNIKPEIFWSQFRRRAAEGLENAMQQGVNEGWYDTHVILEVMVFRFVWMPLVQSELDDFVERYNTSAKRANKKTVLPTGRPKYIFENPEDYQGKQLGVYVPPVAISEVRMRYADPGHFVFEWMPPAIHHYAQLFYASTGGGIITRDTAWGCYHQILDLFRRMEISQRIGQELEFHTELMRQLQESAESGSHRGDGWLYPLEYEVQEEQAPEEAGDLGGVPEVEFSGDEASVDVGVF